MTGFNETAPFLTGNKQLPVCKVIYSGELDLWPWFFSAPFRRKFRLTRSDQTPIKLSRSCKETVGWKTVNLLVGKTMLSFSAAFQLSDGK